MGYQLSSTLYGAFLPILLLELLLSNITGNAPYPDDSASSVLLVPMLRKEPFLLIPLPTLRNISILPEVLLPCFPQISEAIAVSLLVGFLCCVAEALL